MNNETEGELLSRDELIKLVGKDLEESLLDQFEVRHKIPAGYSIKINGGDLVSTKDILKNLRKMNTPFSIQYPEDIPTYHKHMFKCMACGLHFTTFSDFLDWPNEGTTRDQKLGEATGLVYCPECGSTSSKIHWHEEHEGFIFEEVPGGSLEMKGFR